MRIDAGVISPQSRICGQQRSSTLAYGARLHSLAHRSAAFSLTPKNCVVAEKHTVRRILVGLC